ncbi:hypothetical protein ACLOAV_010154 [Pseudogymnoascus australis]
MSVCAIQFISPRLPADGDEFVISSSADVSPPAAPGASRRMREIWSTLLPRRITTREARGVAALPLLKYAFDRGINTWDTANVYSNGESERLMGKAIRAYNIPRQKVVIMTKCYRVICDQENHDPGSGITMLTGLADQSKDYVNQWGLSRGAIFSDVEASLERLNTKYIDLYQVHRYDETVSPRETMEALHDLVKSGRVRYLGASSMWAHQFALLQQTAEKYGLTKFVSMQNHYNLLYREEEREMNKLCDLTGVGLIPWAPLAAGRLAYRSLPDP